MAVPLKELGSKLSYQEVNDMLKLYPSDTQPSNPFNGQIWLDTSATPNQLKRCNGSGWDIVGEIISPLILQTTGENAEFICQRTEGATAVIGAGESIVYTGSQSNHTFRLYVNNSWVMKLNPDGSIVVSDNRFVITADGYVGIGTVSPSYPIHMSQTGENMMLYLDRTDGAKLKVNVTDNQGQIGTQSSHPLHIVTGNLSRITCDVSGNVGIGMTPTTKLDVDGPVKISGNFAWHAGNDGSGSGLDADKLDGQEGSFYQNADNLNSGSVSRARLSELGDVNNPYICANKTNVTQEWQIVGFGTAYTSTPKVVTTVDEAGRIARVTSITTTQFQVQREKANYPDFDFDAGYVYWIAFGNKI